MITITREKLIISVRKRAGMILAETQRDTSDEKKTGATTKKSPPADLMGALFLQMHRILNFYTASMPTG